MAYGSRRIFGYDSDRLAAVFGLKLSELIYEGNPGLGTPNMITPPAGSKLPRLGSNVTPRYVYAVNGNAKSRRKVTVLSVGSDVWLGNVTALNLAATDPDQATYDLEVLEFPIVSYVGEQACDVYTTGADTGMTQGDVD